MSALKLAIDFGAGGNAPEFAVSGFGEPEPSHCWMIGSLSQLRLPVAARGQAHVIVLHAVPFLRPPTIVKQSVRIALNAEIVATMTVADEFVFALHVPPKHTAGEFLLVSFFHVDSEASRAVDVYRDGQSMGLLCLSLWVFAPPARSQAERVVRRPLGGASAPALVQAVERATGRDIASLLMAFESLGHRCAFGAFQARYGADPLGLLRYAGLSTPRLVHNLMHRFAGMGAPKNLHAFIPENAKGLYRLYDRHVEIWYNTSQLIAQVSPEDVVALAARRLPFLRRKFLETLESGEKIFIVNRASPMTEPEALAIFAALDMFARNTFVWTNQDGRLPPGTVVRLAPGFYYGQLDRGGYLGDPSDEAWLNVVANAALLRAEESGLETS